MGYKAAMTAPISTSSRLQPLRRPKCPALLAGAFVVMLLTGCAAPLPKHVERPVSTALSQPQSTDLGLFISQTRPAKAKPDASAFALISGPRHALSSRMALVENAQKTLDLQYYAIHADQSTGRLLRAVVQAARRGVRVRVLLDDFHSTGPDAQVMRLAFVPNV